MDYPTGMVAENIPREAAIVASITKHLDQTPHCWYIKTHGSGMGRTGVPDILGSYFGRCFALEVKRPHVGVVSPKQRYELEKLALAGAKVAIVESWEDAANVLGL